VKIDDRRRVDRSLSIDLEAFRVYMHFIPSDWTMVERDMWRRNEASMEQVVYSIVVLGKVKGRLGISEQVRYCMRRTGG
jgi:hypothetical protein